MRNMRRQLEGIPGDPQARCAPWPPTEIGLLMKLHIPRTTRRRILSGGLASTLAAAVAAVMVAVTPTQALAIATPVPLGTTASYSVLAGQGVTNTGNSVLDHDLGTHPNPAITGFPPGLVLGARSAPRGRRGRPGQERSDRGVQQRGRPTDRPSSGLPARRRNRRGPGVASCVHRATSGVGLTGDLILNAGETPTRSGCSRSLKP